MRTLLVSAQNQDYVDLKDFKRGEHLCVVFDEADHKYVIRNKQVFQAGLDTITLGQSATMSFKYSVWMYGVPLVVCTNDWCVNDVPEHHKAWLDANSVVLQVTERMWLHEEMLPLEFL